MNFDPDGQFPGIQPRVTTLDLLRRTISIKPPILIFLASKLLMIRRSPSFEDGTSLKTERSTRRLGASLEGEGNGRSQTPNAMNAGRYIAMMQETESS